MKIFGYIWATPTTLGALLLWFLPMWALKQFRPIGWKDGAFEWSVREGSWFAKHYSKWAATTLGYCILLNSTFLTDVRIHIHERRHVWQNWFLGPLFLPVYGIACLFATQAGLVPEGYSRLYYYNFLEVDARNYAKKVMDANAGTK